MQTRRQREKLEKESALLQGQSGINKIAYESQAVEERFNVYLEADNTALDREDVRSWDIRQTVIGFSEFCSNMNITEYTITVQKRKGN